MTTDDVMYILIVQLTESLDVIISEKLLVPTFKNSCDSPDNIFELPYGIDTFESLPKICTSTRVTNCFIDIVHRHCVLCRSNILFECDFIQEDVKLLEVTLIVTLLTIYNVILKEKLRELYKAPESTIFWQEEGFIKKYDRGGTNFWPLEYFYIVTELNYKCL